MKYSQSYAVLVDTSGVLAKKKIERVAVGGTHACALAQGKAYCWGDNRSGQLGSGSTAAYSAVPVAVATKGALAGKTIQRISAGISATCVVADGAPYCWGSNTRGLIGGFTGSFNSTPVAITTGGSLRGLTVTDVGVGENSACVLASSRVFCWGFGYFTATGIGYSETTLVPKEIIMTGALAGRKIQQLAVGVYVLCVLADGAPFCWGSSFALGTGNSGEALVGVPTAVDLTGELRGKTVTSVSAGGLNACVMASGWPYCWGRGHTGNGASWAAKTYRPTAVTATGALSGLKVLSVTPTVYNTFVIAQAPAGAA